MTGIECSLLNLFLTMMQFPCRNPDPHMFDAHEMIAQHGLDEARRLAKTKLEHTCINAAAAMLGERNAEPAYASLMVTSRPRA